MIASGQDIRLALQGVFELARLRQSGLGYFRRDIIGFWQSFTAALISLPVIFLDVFLGTESVPAAMSGLHFAVNHILIYVINWLLFPLIIFYLLKVTNRRHLFFDFIVPYHWANLPITFLIIIIQVAIGAPILLLFGVICAQITPILLLFGVICALWIVHAVARFGLQLPVPHAIGFVLFSFALNLVVDFQLRNLAGI